jgi:hypothetical protein
MWMRSCAVCKALLGKPHLWDSIRCQCGWEWQSSGDEPVRSQSGAERTNNVVHRPVAEVVRFYIPSALQKQGKRTPTELRGKVIEFCVPAKKPA